MATRCASKPDAATRRWMRNASDEAAVRNGCKFNEARGQFVVDWIQSYCILYEGEKAGQRMTLEDWQYDATMRAFGWVRFSDDWKRWVRRFNRASIFVAKKNAKALALDTPIPTPFGWTTIGELRPGDTVFSEFGKKCNVVETHPVIVDEETCEITFSNGDKVVCNGEHLWETTALQRSVSCGSKGKLFTGNKWTGSLDRKFKRKDVRTTREIAGSLLRGDGARNHSITLQKPLELPDRRDLPLDPYILGCWLGDGDSDSARITCSEADYDSHSHEFIMSGFSIVANKSHDRAIRFRFQSDADKTPTRTLLKRMSLFKNKHIPRAYLRGSFRQRLALLQGLMDTDGCASKDGKCLTYTTKLATLADGVGELLSSLGVKYSTKIDRPVISGRERTYYKIQFHAYREHLPSFRLARKLNRMRSIQSLVMRGRSETLQITDIRRVAPVPTRCITVDNPTGMFLCGRTMIPTHNSPSAAAWGLYLFAGDGEPGQKVYSTAKDGKQALISHMHAVEMVRRSPDLFSECKINQSTWQINHLPSASIYRVVAGDNRKSQEGLNGSVIVDETHVVDRELMTILRGAGISRSEPLQAEFSTAGNNPDGYGKSQWDYGTSVNAGEFEDQGFLFIPYAAPQDLTDSDLDEDPIKYARMANPTLGRIVKEEEFLASYQTAKRSLTDLLAFKMYRLNIWQRSANPWLKIGDWEACRNDFTEADLEGAECFAGLDLSRTRDMCALALLFPDWEQESYYLLPYFWLPEAVATEQGHLAPFRQWAASGHLELTPGNVVDYGFIKARFREKARQFNIRLLSYDMTYANELTQSLEQGEFDPTGRELAEATGIERQAFPQTIMAFAAPTAEFERLVMAGKMMHNGHPVMNWQVGHVQVKTDANQNKRPVKPNSGDIRKIDGCVAGIMALAGAMERGPEAAACKVEAW